MLGETYAERETEWGNLWSWVSLFLYAWECTAGGKEGNGVQMYCIQHRALNFNRYIMMCSPAALLFQTSKPPTFLTLVATAPPSPFLLPAHTPDYHFLIHQYPLLFFSFSLAVGCINFTFILFSLFNGRSGYRQAVASFELLVLKAT